MARIFNASLDEEKCKSDPFLKALTEKLTKGESLTEDEAARLCDEFLSVNLEDFDTDYSTRAKIIQLPAVLTLLKTKGETAAEVGGFLRSMKKRMVIPESLNAIGNEMIDIVGTGGDGHNTVNISTGASVLAAACGMRVSKVGSFKWSSECGVAEVLTEFGILVMCEASDVIRCIETVGIGFFLSTKYNSTMVSARQFRTFLGVPTIFNAIGPLLNPTFPKYKLVGVFKKSLLPIVAEAFKQVGVKRGCVVHCCGMDEVTPVGATEIYEVTEESPEPKQWILDPLNFGIPRCKIEDLRGGNRQVNAKILRDVFDGLNTGPVADTIVLNAALAMYIHEIDIPLSEAINTTRQTLREGKATEILQRWISVSSQSQ